MNGRIDWMEMIVNALPDYPDGIIWSDGEEILVKTESAADTIVDLIEALYRAQGEEILVNMDKKDILERIANAMDLCGNKVTLVERI